VCSSDLKKVFPQWGLDWPRIRAAGQDATFNAYDVTRQRLRGFSPSEMSEDVLCACISQAVWFPAVELDDGCYTDAVFVTDANVESAIAKGADELWVIWTVSTRPDWLPGLVAQFFHAIESSANGHLSRVLDRIERNNAELASGGVGCFGRHITVRMLRAEVPTHYLVVLGADRLHRAVERGVRTAREWCDQQGVPYTPFDHLDYYRDGVSLRFSDAMHGRLTMTSPDGSTEPNDTLVDANLKLIIRDTGCFVASPEPHATIEGTVHAPLLGGELLVESGTAEILVDDGDPTRKEMRYRIFLRGSSGACFTLVGVKTLESGDIRQLWSESTTLHTRIMRGHLTCEDDSKGNVELIATGILRLGLLDVARQMATVHVEGPSVRQRVRGAGRFVLMFTGNLWDVYARRILSYAPF
jgi:hypothetical protein